jgi:3-hydroxybutyrate dehydrogenase
MEERRVPKGKTVLITGSVGGIGLATAHALAAQGCNVMLNGFAPESEIEAARTGLERKHGIKCGYHGADLTKPNEIEALVKAATGLAEGVDILVNNAVVRHFAPVESFPVEHWDRALAVNLSAPYHLIRLTLPGMRSRGWGRIVNMASVLGMLGTEDRIDYVTTKTALIGMTRVVALETKGTEITCNAICPGSVLTPNIDGRLKAMMAAENLTRDAAVKKFLSTRQKSGRFVEAESVAALIAFLCSKPGGDISGAALPIDTGWAAGIAT